MSSIKDRMKMFEQKKPEQKQQSNENIMKNEEDKKKR